MSYVENVLNRAFTEPPLKGWSFVHEQTFCNLAYPLSVNMPVECLLGLDTYFGGGNGDLYGWDGCGSSWNGFNPYREHHGSEHRYSSGMTFRTLFGHAFLSGDCVR